MLAAMQGVKTVLVTGCTGLVGHGICTYLLKQGYTVIGTARRPLRSTHPSFRIHDLDLQSPESIARLHEVVPIADVFIHTAGVIPTGERLYTHDQGRLFFEVNFLATYQMLKLFSGYADKKFIYISGTRLAKTSSQSVVEDMPFCTDDEYSTSKLCGELLCRQFANQGLLCPTVLRISAPYGYVLDSGAVIPRFIQRVLHSDDLEVFGTGSRSQVFTFVEDIGRACELAWQKDAQGVFNVTGGTAVTMKELAETIVRTFPNGTSHVTVGGKPDPQESVRVEYSIEKAKRVLGYEPQYDIVSGLKKISESMKDPSQISIFEAL